MDEIGPWQNGAIPDADAKDDHLALVREALWGHLLAGGSGVEWYFGAKFDHNDLSAEDFRSREKLWVASAAARQLIEQTMDINSRNICPSEMASTPCLMGQVPGSNSRVAIVYLRSGQSIAPDLTKRSTSASYFNPLNALEPIRAGKEYDRIAVVLFR